MEKTGMLRIYRVLAIGLVGYGLFLLSGVLGPPEGVEVLVPENAFFFFILWLILGPATANLVNSFLGSRFVLLRWGVVIINAAGFLTWLPGAFDGGWEENEGLQMLLLLTLLALSILLALAWGKTSIQAKEGDLS